MLRRPPRSTLSSSSAASDVYKRQAFNSDFKLSDEYSVKLTPQPGALNIYRPDGTYLFSVSTFNDSIRFTRKSNLSAVLYFAFILMMLAHLNVWLRRIKRFLPGQKLFISLGVSVVIYLVFNGLKIPASLYQTDLFSPASFAFSGWLASLGEFILLSILMFHGAQAFFVLTDFEKVQKGRSVWMIFSFLFGAFFFTFSVALMKILLLNSSISLEFFSDLKFSAINLYAFFGISLHVIGFVIIVLRLRSGFYKGLGFYKFVLALFIAGAIAGTTVSMFCFRFDWFPFIYYCLAVLIIALFEVFNLREFKYT